MPYGNNEGVSIYYEVEGEGPPLVLEHGLLATLEVWRLAGYVEALSDDYQLILVDARGHGNSDKPHDPEAYRLDLMAADIVAVLDDLKLSKAHYLGFSMGGLIGWGLAKYAPERFHSLLIQGSGLIDNRSVDFINSLRNRFSQEGMDGALEWLSEIFGEGWTPELKTMFQSNDLDAIITLMEGKIFRPVVPDPGNWLPTVTLPSLLIAGEASGNEYSDMQECAKSMPNATFVSLPELDHIESNLRLDLVLPHIIKFLSEVSQV